MRSALQNLRESGIMFVYLRQGCIGEPKPSGGGTANLPRLAKAPRNAHHIIDYIMSNGLLQQHLSIEN